MVCGQMFNTQAYLAGFESLLERRDVLEAATDKALIRWLRELKEDKCGYNIGGADVIRAVLRERGIKYD